MTGWSGRPGLRSALTTSPPPLSGCALMMTTTPPGRRRVAARWVSARSARAQALGDPGQHEAAERRSGAAAEILEGTSAHHAVGGGGRR